MNRGPDSEVIDVGREQYGRFTQFGIAAPQDADRVLGVAGFRHGGSLKVQHRSIGHLLQQSRCFRAQFEDIDASIQIGSGSVVQLRRQVGQFFPQTFQVLGLVRKGHHGSSRSLRGQRQSLFSHLPLVPARDQHNRARFNFKRFLVCVHLQ